MRVLKNLCIIALLAQPYCATQARIHAPLSMQDAVLMALRHNPNVRSQKMQRVLDKFNLRVAKNAYELRYALSASTGYTHTVVAGDNNNARASHLRPSVSWRSHWGTELTGAIQNNYDRGQYHPTVDVDFTQPLLRGFGRRIADIDLLNAHDAEKISRIALRSQISQTIANVVKAYRQLIQNQERLNIQQRNLKDSIESLKQVRIKIKAGVLAPRDTVVAERQIAEQRLALRIAQNDYLQRKLALLRNLWLPTSTPVRLDDRIRIKWTRLPTLSFAQKMALKQNFNYQQQRIQLDEVRRSNTRALDNSRWKLNLKAHQTFSNGTHSGLTPLTTGRNQETFLGLNLEVPIHDLRNKQSRLQANIQLKKAKLKLQVAKRELMDDIKIRLRALNSQKAQLKLAQQAEKLAAKSLTLAKKKQIWGHGTIEDVTNARTHLIDLQTRVLDTKISYLNSVTDLNATLGRLPDIWHVRIRQ